MHALFVVFHIIICIMLIAIVLLQTGRGAEIGAAFGGASRTLFGASGATTVMGKITAVVAILFMINCLVLTYYSGRPISKSIMDKPVAEESLPKVPEAKPVPVPVTKTEEPSSGVPASTTDQATTESADENGQKVR
ncbi:preprotein translocase subunit SecG [Thermodesulforhabdus norvegica]|uniref:Protein-export membrane protein SecG n=1 Tax=Thermodesulforhabdus norvegica TaxID=39841 RepID=A0A1I4VJX3_9BACT|nr:preprotein translocase subunit SecG [Thermodesulforhabdus norvegica]SFN01415.1 protein translocase subunit secG [Thermodesulforhabdus norvegica]